MIPIGLAMISVFHIVELVAIAAVLGWLVMQSLEAKRSQSKILQAQEEMKKEFKTQGDELSKKLAGLSAKTASSASMVEQTQAELSEFKARLESFLSSLNRVENTIPDLVDLNRKLGEAKANLDAFAKEVASATAKTGELELSHDSAIRRIRELEQATLELQQNKGIAPVLPNRDSIAEATQRAADLAWQQGATSEAQLAKRLAGEEGELILRAFDAALANDPEGAAAIIDASSYDPFTLHQNLWEGAIAAKRTLELARAAAIAGMERYGFKLEKPRVGIDSYDKDLHDLRDSFPTDKEELKGKIAEVRRPGLSQNGKVVRPARVVQFAIDYKKVAPASLHAPVELASAERAPTESVAMELEPIEPSSVTSTPVPAETIKPPEPYPAPSEKKGGLSQF
jgi:hypothetical protein